MAGSGAKPANIHARDGGPLIDVQRGCLRHAHAFEWRFICIQPRSLGASICCCGPHGKICNTQDRMLPPQSDTYSVKSTHIVMCWRSPLTEPGWCGGKCPLPVAEPPLSGGEVPKPRGVGGGRIHLRMQVHTNVVPPFALFRGCGAEPPTKSNAHVPAPPFALFQGCGRWSPKHSQMHMRLCHALHYSGGAGNGAPCKVKCTHALHCPLFAEAARPDVRQSVTPAWGCG